VMAEVIEHLLVPPEAILAWVREWLRPGGEAVVQTPNAVHLLRRLKMLAGSNPFMRIPLPIDETFHVREYTLRELRAAGEQAGLQVTGIVRRNYFRHKGWKGKLLEMAGPLLPGGLREGITITLRRP
jgi:2-polyprenyl-3-methyl-5-hydroxy-6-metoxy-1,4-benzoquinol methylase